MNGRPGWGERTASPFHLQACGRCILPPVSDKTEGETAERKDEVATSPDRKQSGTRRQHGVVAML